VTVSLWRVYMMGYMTILYEKELVDWVRVGLDWIELGWVSCSPLQRPDISFVRLLF